jgi:hypothetical protein
MTPKEKAQELVDKYKDIDIEISSEYKGYGDGADYLLMDNGDAKQCALIAVNEMINIIKYTKMDCQLNILEYWKEVKKEIKNL